MSNSNQKSFTNSLYDTCNLDKKNQESVGPYNWITDNVYESSNACYVNQSPFQHNQFHHIPRDLVDVENDLRNQNRTLSRCPDNKFDPTKLDNCKLCEKCNDGLPCGCGHCKETKHENKINDCTTQFLVPNYSRLNKSCNYPGITINRFQPLCEDPQDLNKIQENSYIGVDTRNFVKDAFKASEQNVRQSGTYRPTFYQTEYINEKI
jgi:hypothetical protein